jgi:sulfonate transport system substrate-binding protein
MEITRLKGLCVIGFVFIATIFTVLWYSDQSKTEQALPESTQHRPADNPVYAKYDFSCADNAIRIGVQPLYLPTGLITEAIRRDHILHQELSVQDQEICFYPFLKGSDVNYFLERGDLDAGVGGDMPAIAAAANLEVFIPTIMQQGFLSIVAKRLMFIKDLRNQRLAFAPGSNAHFALLSTLASAGLNETNTRLIPLEVSDMPEALQKGHIDAFAAWEPTPAIALFEQKENVVIHQNLSTGYLYFTQAFAQAHPATVRIIIAAQMRALKWLTEDKQNLLSAAAWNLEAEAILTGEKPIFNPEQITELANKDILRSFQLPFVPSRQLKENGPLHQEFLFLRDLGKVDASSSWQRVHDSFDRSFVADVLRRPDKYRLNQFEYDQTEAAHD